MLGKLANKDKHANSSETNLSTTNITKKTENCDTNAKQNPNANIETEFVSDTFQTTDKDLEEVRAGMKILGIDTLASTAATAQATSGKPNTFFCSIAFFCTNHFFILNF